MADKNTPSDAKPTRDSTPISNPKVDVAVDPPKKGRDADYEQKVKRRLEGEVREAIRKGEGDGSKKQLENVRETVKKAADQIDPNKVKKVRVRVSGDVGGDPLKETVSEPTKEG